MQSTKQFLQRITNSFAALAMAATIVALLTYGIGQLLIRAYVDRGPVEVAGGAALAIQEGLPVTIFDKDIQERVDLRESATTFLIVYDEQFVPIAAGATIGGVIPKPSADIFETAKTERQHRVTWEPEGGLRIASVIVKYEGGYVLAGKSLKASEGYLMFLALVSVVLWIALLIAAYFVTRRRA